ncbi:hypothetical protein ABIA31_008261 [Catenulispora sp. MAP5-51]
MVSALLLVKAQSFQSCCEPETQTGMSVSGFGGSWMAAIGTPSSASALSGRFHAAFVSAGEAYQSSSETTIRAGRDSLPSWSRTESRQV